MKRASEEGEMLRGAGELVEKFRPQGINGIRYDCATQVKDRERLNEDIKTIVWLFSSRDWLVDWLELVVMNEPCLYGAPSVVSIPGKALRDV